MFVDTSLTTSFSAINYQLCNHKNRDRIRTILTSPTLKKTTAFNFFLNIVFMLSECCFSSVQFSCSVVSDSATPWTAACQASLSITKSWTCSNSCPLSQWCHSTISSSVVPFFSCLQSFPASGSFSRSQFFPSGGQSIGASASASVLPMNAQDWLLLGWTGWISLQSKGLSRVFSNTTVQKHQFFSTQPSFCSNSHPWLAQFFTISRPVSFLCDSGR